MGTIEEATIRLITNLEYLRLATGLLAPTLVFLLAALCVVVQLNLKREHGRRKQLELELAEAGKSQL